MVLVWFSLVFRLKNWKVTRGGDFLQFFFEIFLREVTFLKSEKVGRGSLSENFFFVNHEVVFNFGGMV